MPKKIVARGYVLVYSRFGQTKVSAVVSGPDAEGLRRHVGGVIIPAKGMEYRTAQGTLRILVNPTEAVALAEQKKAENKK